MFACKCIQTLCISMYWNLSVLSEAIFCVYLRVGETQIHTVLEKGMSVGLHCSLCTPH